MRFGRNWSDWHHAGPARGPGESLTVPALNPGRAFAVDCTHLSWITNDLLRQAGRLTS
jgi:hypothetical protein